MTRRAHRRPRPTSLGSIPFGVLITRALGLGDLRGIGSGNIGATNVLRTGNKAAAAATLLLDAGKGAVAVLLARALVGETAAMVAGFAAFLGHLFPVWLQLPRRQGRRHLPRRDARARLARGPRRLRHLARDRLRLPLLVARGAGRGGDDAALAGAARPARRVWFGIALAALVFVRHHANIGRLLAGTEPKIGGGR